MKTNIYSKYAELKALISELEEQKDQLQAIILADMDDESATTIKNDYGQFQIMQRNTFDYSIKVQKIEQRLKTLKQKEENNGTAVIKTSTRHLRFVGAKEVAVKKEKSQAISKSF